MKTSTKHQEPTAGDLGKALIYIFGLFTVAVLVLAGADLINQIMIWIF